MSGWIVAPLWGIFVILVLIFWKLHRLEKKFDPNLPVNCYGENLSDAIQNAHVRGLKGISTYDV